MNLHDVVRGAITSVNPDTVCTWQQSTGYRYANDGTGKQIPTFNTVFNVRAQVQGLSSPDLQHAERMNLQGLLRKIYVYGSINGVVRAEFMGGDLIVFNDGNPAPVWAPTAQGPRPVLNSSGLVVFGITARVWKVVQVSERYPGARANGWTGAIIVMQSDQAPNFVTDSNGKFILDSYGQLVQVAQYASIQPAETA